MNLPEGIFNVIIMENKADKVFCCFVKMIYDYAHSVQRQDKCTSDELYRKIMCILPLFLLNVSDTEENQTIISKLREKAEKLCNCDC